MSRPSFHNIYMRLAELMSERSTCSRTDSTGRQMQVGCTIVSTDFRQVYSAGYNGNASGLPNMCDSTEPGKCGCFPSGTRVDASSVQAAYRRRYEGDMCRVITRNGEFTATPNHPILVVGRGWVAAEALNKGEHLLATDGRQNMPPVAPEGYHGVAIEDVFESLAVTGRLVRRPGARVEFHGDGLADQDVDVVWADRSLGSDAERLQQLGQPTLSGADEVSAVFRREGFVVASHVGGEGSARFFRGAGHACEGTGFEQALAYNDSTRVVHLRKEHHRVPQAVPIEQLIDRQRDHGLSLVPAEVLGDLAQDTAFTQAVLHRRVADAVHLRDRQNSLTGLVAADQVIGIERKSWAGHVYNLQTRTNWFRLADTGSIAHNCLHAEANAIVSCSASRVEPKVLFCTNLPCRACAKLIIQLGGVREVYYRRDYRLKDSLAIFAHPNINITVGHLFSDETTPQEAQTAAAQALAEWREDLRDPGGFRHEDQKVIDALKAFT